MAADLVRADAEATRLLLSQRLYSPRIDVTAFSYDRNIVFDSFAGFCGKSRAALKDIAAGGALPDGCTLRSTAGGQRVYIILYNERIRSQKRRRFTLAHELGHVFLGHEDDGDISEAEANRFAAQLLLPSVLVWELLTRSDFGISARELADIFATSHSAAEYRMYSLKTSPPMFSNDDARLLKKLGGMLPCPDGPLIDC